MSIIKTYRYKLKPTKKQEQIFYSWLGTCRFVYNCSLEYKILMYSKYDIILSKFDIMNEFAPKAGFFYRRIDFIFGYRN